MKQKTQKEAHYSHGHGHGHGILNAKPPPPVDPLSNYWGLSLFHQTSFSASTSKPYDPDHDLHQFHNHLRSMALRSPAKLVDQLKSILDENAGPLNSEISTDPTCDEESDVVAEEEEAGEIMRKRRPALGFKRARFSLKPTKIPSIESLIPSPDIDKLKDPAEFFLAHERMENAKRELQKQMDGVSLEPSQDNIPTKPRQRRPGLSGNNQRPVRYRHRYPKETIVNYDSVPSSQEAIGSVSLGPIGKNTDNVVACLTPSENDVSDSPAIEENKINDILDGLLRCNAEDLEGDGAITLLQERLQIKPVVLEKLFVPDFPDNQVADMKSLHGNLSKPRKRKALSNINNLLKGMNHKTPLRQDVGCPVQQSASPTPPRSPFAPLSSLQKLISQSKPSVDPFSAHEIGDCIAVSKTSSVVDTVSTSGNSREDNSGMTSTKLNEFLLEDIIAVSEVPSVEDAIKIHASSPQRSMEDNSREPEFNANIQSNGPLGDIDGDIGGSGMNDMVEMPNIETSAPCEVEDEVEKMQGDGVSVPTNDLNFDSVNQLDQSGPPEFQANAPNEGTNRSVDDSELCLQEKTEGDSVLPDNGQRGVKHARKQYKDKKTSRRKSLAAAGTSWESGLRRSTRIRTRPLEYWKGEKMVYGRVHTSLATVIGVKCISPGSDGKPIMKVKSYVSDRYKELLDLASQY